MKTSPRLRLRPDVLSRDLLASVVVFLVAVPLCVGIAVASGVPAELGLVTGIVGIGIGLIGSQLYALAGAEAHGNGLDNLAGLPELLTRSVSGAPALSSCAIDVGAIAVLILWKRLPGRLPRLLPGPLVAVGLAILAVAVLDLPVATIEVRGLVDSLNLTGLDDIGLLADPAPLSVVLAFTLIASAESLFSAAAVDRMHDGPRSHYNKELIAQGAGNTLCGLVGALPMTAVIVRAAPATSRPVPVPRYPGSCTECGCCCSPPSSA